jgi:sulfonate transport system substrate-binding protein
MHCFSSQRAYAFTGRKGKRGIYDMRQRRIALPLALLLALSFAFSSLSCVSNSGTGSAPATTITIATFSKALGNSPYHIAKHFHWFEEDPSLKGMKINYTEFNDRPAISDAFSKGDLQVLFSAEVPSILCRAQGNDTRIVALSANVGQSILVRSDLPIKSVPDLRGKSLAVLQGTSSHYGLLKILKTFNLRESDVDIRYMPPAEAKVAFETDKLDAWAVWAPFVEQQEVSGKGRSVEGGDAIINSVMTMSAPFIKDHEAASRAVVAVIQRAKKWIQDNPDEAQKIMAQELSLDPQVVKKAWGKHNWNAQLDDAVITDIQEKATFLAEADKTRAGKTLNVRSELIDSRFNVATATAAGAK